MQDGEYNIYRRREAVAEGGGSEGRDTIFLVGCNLQLFSCTTMMRKLITHWSGRLYSYPLSSLDPSKGGKSRKGDR
jgi:hypothetical protein